MFFVSQLVFRGFLSGLIISLKEAMISRGTQYLRTRSCTLFDRTLLYGWNEFGRIMWVPQPIRELSNERTYAWQYHLRSTSMSYYIHFWQIGTSDRTSVRFFSVQSARGCARPATTTCSLGLYRKRGCRRLPKICLHLVPNTNTHAYTHTHSLTYTQCTPDNVSNSI